MTFDILDIILAVRTYKKWYIKDNFVRHNHDADWFTATEDYYHSLPLPDGLEANRQDFERILQIPHADLIEWNKMDQSDLAKVKW